MARIGAVILDRDGLGCNNHRGPGGLHALATRIEQSPTFRCFGGISPAFLLPLALAGCHSCGAPDAGGGGPDPAPAGEPASPELSAAPGYDPSWTKPSGRALGGDPLRGAFDLDDATIDLPAEGELVATLDTSLGSIRCTLWPERAPRTVANFVGLANGHRPHKVASGWDKGPAYDGSSFHRVLPGTGIVGGRLYGAVRDSPGYWLADEPWPGMRHDRAGLLCTRGVAPDRVGSEFLITSAPAPILDASDAGRRPAFTVFGRCTPLALIARIAADGDEHGRPQTLVRIDRIRVERLASEPTAGTESAGSSAGSASQAAASSAKRPENGR